MEKSSILLQFKIIELESEEAALSYLFESLIDMLNNIEACEEFLQTAKNEVLSTDAMVHILNALSPVKTKIGCWDEFVQDTFKKLTKNEGETNAKDLLKVIL